MSNPIIRSSHAANSCERAVRRSHWQIASVGLLLGCMSSGVHASGFALLEQSASRLGTAFSGTAAAADDASTLFYNPAGLARLERSEVLMVVSGVGISSQFRNDNSQAALGQPLGAQGGDAGGWAPIPAGYFAMPLNEQLAFGVGVNAPFGLKLEYDDGWMGRFQALKSEIETINVSPSLSWRLNERLTLGVGVNYQKIQAELTNAVNYSAVVAQGLQQLAGSGQIPPAAVPGLIAANAGLEGFTRVRGDDTAWGFTAGLLYEFTPDTRIGLSYRSSMDYRLSGAVRFEAPVATQPLGIGIIESVSAANGRLATGPASVALKLPEIATASLYHRAGRFEWMADVAWTGWSSVQELRIVRDGGEVLSVTPEHWEDTWRVALGGAWQLNDQWKLRGGIAYDQTNVPASTRTARLPDAQRKWVAIGAQWDSGGPVVIDVGYAHLLSDDVGLNQDDGNALANGLIHGRQESGVDIVSAQMVYRF